MDIPATILIGVFTSLLGAFIGYKGHERSQRKEHRDDGKQDGVILTEIGYIKSGVDDIKRKQERQDEKHIETITRVTAVEASAKQAHYRIDRIDDIIDDILKQDCKNPHN